MINQHRELDCPGNCNRIARAFSEGEFWHILPDGKYFKYTPNHSAKVDKATNIKNDDDQT